MEKHLIEKLQNEHHGFVLGEQTLAKLHELADKQSDLQHRNSQIAFQKAAQSLAVSNEAVLEFLMFYTGVPIAGVANEIKNPVAPARRLWLTRRRCESIKVGLNAASAAVSAVS